MNKYENTGKAIDPNSRNDYSEIWGWTSPSGKEYAIIGTTLGSSIVDITASDLKESAFLPGPYSYYKYHEFRTYGNYLFIGSEGSDLAKRAGIQIVDLSTLPDSASFKKSFVWIDTVDISPLTTKLYYRAHTVSIEKNYLYVNGGDFGGTRIMDIEDPLNPKQVGSYGKGSTPYVHDAFIRNDTLYAAAIFDGSVDIVDFTMKGHFTEKSAGVMVSVTPTIPEFWSHQVWLSDDSRYMYVSSEASNGKLHIYDISDKKNPIEISSWMSNPNTSIHNSFVKGNYLYIAYYTEGFRVLDISDPYTPIEVAFYKTYSNPSAPLFAGSWGVYPYFASGKIAVSDMNTGLYIFTVDEKKGGRVNGVVRDAGTNAPLADVKVTVTEMGRSIMTDSAGKYLYGSAEGTHTISFSKPGYITRLETVNTLPGLLESFNIELTQGVTSMARDRDSRTPDRFELFQNYPNPFNPSTKISFKLQSREFTSLKVFNSLGQKIAVLVNQELEAGVYTVEFDASMIPSGLYFYSLQSGNATSSKRMVLTR